MRKIKFTKVLIKLIADCLFDGLTDDEIALLAGLSSKTIQRVRAGDDCPIIKAATLQRKRVYIARIRDGTNPQWQRIAWFLERRYPKEFSKPEVQLQIDASSSSTTNNTLIITAEQAANLRSRSSAIETELARLTPRQSRDADASSQEKFAGVVKEELAKEKSEPESGAASDASSNASAAGSEEEGHHSGTRTPGQASGTPDPTLPRNSQSGRFSSNSRKSKSKGKSGGVGIPKGGVSG